MNDKKIVFFDIDGTLVDSSGVIPESAKKALKELKKNGHLRFLCTGRTLCMIEDALLDLDFDGIVCAAGGYVVYNNEVIYTQEFEDKELECILPVLDEYNVEYVLEGKDNLFVPRVLFDDNTNNMNMLIEKMRSFTKVIEDSEKLSVMKFTSTFYESNQHDLDQVIEKLSSICSVIIHDHMVYVGSDDRPAARVVEFVPKGNNKAEGIKKTIEYLGVKWENTFAFGDSNNDLEMLSYVNHSVAMGVSSEKAIQASKYRTDTVAEDGIYNGLNRLELI